MCLYVVCAVCVCVGAIGAVGGAGADGGVGVVKLIGGVGAVGVVGAVGFVTVIISIIAPASASSPLSLPSNNILESLAGSIRKGCKQFAPPELQDGSSGFKAARMIDTSPDPVRMKFLLNRREGSKLFDSCISLCRCR